MTDEVEITSENFHEYFFDIRQHFPQRGQVIAQYCANAEFVDGYEKRQVISMLRDTNKMLATTQLMRKLLHASERDSYRVPRMMVEDMVNGMSEDECADKPYKYMVEMFFYVNPEHVPKDDPHWSIISVLNLDEFLDKKDGPVRARIVPREEIAPNDDESSQNG